MMNEEIEQEARRFAVARHGDQKYGDKPYEVHLAAVRQVLREAGYEDGHSLSIAAWLHDVVEDTLTKHEEVEEHFGVVVAWLVWAVTGAGRNRKERNADAYRKIAEAQRAFLPAATLKLADRIANVEASKDHPDKLAMYREEHEEFKAGLDRRGQSSLWERLDRALGVSPAA